MPEEESIIDRIDSEQENNPRYHDEGTKNRSQGSHKIINSKYNRDGLIDNVVDSVEFREPEE